MVGKVTLIPGLVSLSNLVCLFYKVSVFTLLSDTPSKGVVVIDGLGFDDLIALVLGTQAFL